MWLLLHVRRSLACQLRTIITKEPLWIRSIYASTLAYIVDANVGRSSSAVATNSCFRGISAFIAAEAAVPLQVCQLLQNLMRFMLSNVPLGRHWRWRNLLPLGRSSISCRSTDSARMVERERLARKGREERSSEPAMNHSPSPFFLMKSSIPSQVVSRKFNYHILCGLTPQICITSGGTVW